MTKNGKARIGLRNIRALQEHETLWDDRVVGFCARRRNTPAIVYGLKYRTKQGRQRWYTIGRHGAPWTPETARAEAQQVLSEVAKGHDPAGNKITQRHSATIAQICDEYLAAAGAGRLLTRRGHSKKRSTLVTDQSRIAAHIKPLLGSRKISDVARKDVEAFMHDVAEGRTRKRVQLEKPRAVSNVRGGRGAATRTVGLLGAIFNFAIRTGVCDQNPVVGVLRFADGKRDRRLSNSEYNQLGSALERTDGIWPYAVSATRFLAMTGWRSGEALNLRWCDIDFERHLARLPDTKTGFSVRVLSASVVGELDRLARSDDGLVFPSARKGVPMTGFPSLFRKIVQIGELPADITPHVLRHSFASVAADLGFSELTIAALIGHRAGS
uniref:tyrosine-type recombinase/integrase n=1 Tax=Bradyrhizobium sp. TaxID=376 RepID=UPI00260421A8